MPGPEVVCSPSSSEMISLLPPPPPTTIARTPTPTTPPQASLQGGSVLPPTGAPQPCLPVAMATTEGASAVAQQAPAQQSGFPDPFQPFSTATSRHLLPSEPVSLYPHVVPVVPPEMVMSVAMAPLPPSTLPKPPPPPPPLPAAALVEEKVVPLSERCRAAEGCRRYRTHASALTPQRRQFCASHAEPGMMDTRKRLCRSPDCTKQARYTEKAGSGRGGGGDNDDHNNAEFCPQHATEDAVVSGTGTSIIPGSATPWPRKKCLWAGGGCKVRPFYGVPGSGNPEFCARHAHEGLIDLRGSRSTGSREKMASGGDLGRSTNKHIRNRNAGSSRACSQRGCPTRPTYGVKGATAREFCSKHAKPGMVDVSSRRCKQEDCTKRASFGVEGGTDKIAEFCFAHAPPGMVNVRSKRCAQDGCKTRPVFAAAGAAKGEFCAAHASPDMVDVVNKKCQQPGGCRKQPSFGREGDKRASFCAEHAQAGLVNIVSVRCARKGCLKHAAYGKPGNGKTRTSCLEHSEPGMVLIGSLPTCTPQNRRSRAGAPQPQHRQQQQLQAVVEEGGVFSPSPGVVALRQPTSPQRQQTQAQQLQSEHDHLSLHSHHLPQPEQHQMLEQLGDSVSFAEALPGAPLDRDDEAEAVTDEPSKQDCSSDPLEAADTDMAAVAAATAATAVAVAEADPQAAAAALLPQEPQLQSDLGASTCLTLSAEKFAAIPQYPGTTL